MSHETSNQQPQDTREFHIGDILSVTTRRLLSPRGMEGLYDILDYMTGDELSTLQLPRAARECDPALREQHPDLADVDVPEGIRGQEQVDRWLGAMVLRYGESRAVTPLAAEDHTVMDVLQELQLMGLGDKAIILSLENPEMGQ